MDGRKSHEITVLEEFMKENGFTRKDLEAQVGSRSRVSEVPVSYTHLTLPTILLV